MRCVDLGSVIRIAPYAPYNETLPPGSSIIRSYVAVLALAVGAAACGGTTVAETEEATFAYEYVVGETITFDFTMTQGLVANIDLDATPGILGTTEVPDELDITVETTGEITYVINPADDPDSFEIAVSGIITDTSVTGWIDSEAIDDIEDLPTDFSPSTAPPNLILIVDRAGNATPRDAVPTDLFGLLANPASAANVGGIDPMSDHLGPVFPAGSLTTGATWQTEDIRDVLGSPVTTTSSNHLVGVTAADEARVATIESELSSSGFEVSLGTLLALLFGGAEDLVDGAGTGDISSQLDGSGFDLRVIGSPMTGNSTTVFDVGAGRLLSYRTISKSPAEVRLSFPDEESGETVDGLMQLTTTVDFSAKLRDDISSA